MTGEADGINQVVKTTKVKGVWCTWRWRRYAVSECILLTELDRHDNVDGLVHVA